MKLAFQTDNAMEIVYFVPSPPLPGFSTPAFNQAKAAVAAAFGYEDVALLDGDTEAEVLGDFGKPVWNPLKFEATDYQKLVNGNVQDFTTPELFIPICIIEASQNTLMEATPVEGMDGTVKEFAALNDYRVRLKCIFINVDDTFPQSQMNDLIKVRAASVGVDVACEWLGSLGVFNLVIQDIKWIPMPGFINCQAFELECLSDETVYLKLANES
jgi:uncharacterized protein DUF6046